MMQPPEESKSPRRWVRISLKIALSLTALSFCVACATPTLLSTKKGSRALSSFLSKRLGGKIQIETLSLSWLGSQNVEGLSFHDDRDALFFSCGKVSSDASLISILFSKDFGDTLIDAPHLRVKKEVVSLKPIPSRNFDKASLLFVPVITPSIKKILFPMTGKLSLQEGSIDVVTDPSLPLSIFDIKGSAFFALDGSIVSIHVTGLSKADGVTGSLDVDCSLKNINSFTPDLAINAHVTNLPVKVIDDAAALFIPGARGKILSVIGPTLSLTTVCHLSQNVAYVQLNADSSGLKAELSTVLKDGHITLSAPASFSARLPDELLKGLGLPSFGLPSMMQVSGQIDSLSIPISQTGIAFEKTALGASARVEPFHITSSHSEADIGAIELRIDTASIEKGVGLSLNCKLSPSDVSSEVLIKAAITAPLQEKRGIEASITANKVPSQLIDALCSSELPSAIIGNELEATAQLSATGENYKITFSASSENLSLPSAALAKTDTLRLLEPLSLTFTPTDALYRLIAREGMVKAAPSHPLQLSIDHLELPQLSSLSDISCTASLQSSLVAFDEFFSFTPYKIQNLSCELSIQTLSQIKLSATSSLFSLFFDGAVDSQEHVISSHAPLYVKYLITDAQLQSLFGKGPRPYLTDPTNVEMTIAPISIYYKKPIVPQLSLHAELQSQDTNLQSKDGALRFSLQQTTVSLDTKGKEGSLSLLAKTVIHNSLSEAAPLSIAMDVSSLFSNGNIDFNNAKVKGAIELQSIPTSLVDTFLASDISTAKIIGASANLRLHAEKNKDKTSLSFSANSKMVNAQGSFAIEGSTLIMQEPKASLSFTVSQQSQLIMDSLLTKSGQPPRLMLGQDATILLELTNLKLPFTMQGNHVTARWKDSSIMGRLTCLRTSFVDRTSGETLFLKDTQLSAEKKAGPSEIALSLVSEASSTTAKALQNIGMVKGSAVLTDVYTEGQNLTFAKPSVKVDVNIEKMPSIVFDTLARIAGSSSAPFTAVFGPSVTARANMKIKESTGPVEININSSGAKASVVGRLDNGTLTLSETLHAQVMMTQPLSHLLLQVVNPLSISEIRASAPITLKIEPQGFSVPILPFSTQKTNIASARLELGKIQCANEGNISIALGLLKSVQLSQNKYLNLWFTPIDLHIKNGVVDVERTDILIADTFDICLWGNIDPNVNKVDMVLGLTADCLSIAFGIRELPDDYVLQVPLTGSLNDVKINTGKATAKVAALLAWQQAAKAGGKAAGPAGDLLGKLMNKVGSLPLNEKDTPKPKRPFPWESGGASQKKERKEAKNKRAHLKPSDKPLKQLLKVIR